MELDKLGGVVSVLSCFPIPLDYLVGVSITPPCHSGRFETRGTCNYLVSDSPTQLQFEQPRVALAHQEQDCPLPPVRSPAETRKTSHFTSSAYVTTPFGRELREKLSPRGWEAFGPSRVGAFAVLQIRFFDT